MTEDQHEPGIPLIEEAEIARLRSEKQTFLDEHMPLSEADREIADQMNFLILEAMARAAQLRAQNKTDEQ